MYYYYLLSFSLKSVEQKLFSNCIAEIKYFTPTHRAGLRIRAALVQYILDRYFISKSQYYKLKTPNY